MPTAKDPKKEPQCVDKSRFANLFQFYGPFLFRDAVNFLYKKHFIRKNLRFFFKEINVVPFMGKNSFSSTIKTCRVCDRLNKLISFTLSRGIISVIHLKIRRLCCKLIYG